MCTQHPGAIAQTVKLGKIRVNPAEFRSRFNQLPFQIEHDLANHPMFTLERLVKLSKCMPRDRIETVSGKIPVSYATSNLPGTGLSIEETIWQIENNSAWMAMKNIEVDPEYRQLINGLLAPLMELSEEGLGTGACRPEGYILISSPNATTPYHIDHEINFLLQIRGRKQVSVFDRSDRSLLSDRDLESYFAGAHRNIPYQEEYQQKAYVFDMVPGIGCHIPTAAPHWVKNGEEPSVSLSITFRNDQSEFLDMAYQANHMLRQRGWSPRPVGSSHLRDRVKVYGFRAARKFFTPK